jgi:Zn-dependent peptidase ImmA (M78 family)
VTLTNLTRIKATWGVSIKSLVGRFASIGIIDREQARSLYKQISARGWNTGEPVEVAIEKAQWFERVLHLRAGMSDTHAAAESLARTIGANAGDLFSFASWGLARRRPADRAP